jgi:hypothetical protein
MRSYGRRKEEEVTPLGGKEGGMRKRKVTIDLKSKI